MTDEKVGNGTHAIAVPTTETDTLESWPMDRAENASGHPPTTSETTTSSLFPRSVDHPEKGGLVEVTDLVHSRGFSSGLRLRARKAETTHNRIIAVSVDSSTAQKAGWQRGYYLSFHIDVEESLFMLKAEPTRNDGWPTIRQQKSGGSFGAVKTMPNDAIRLMLGDAKERFIPKVELVTVNPQDRTIVFRFANQRHVPSVTNAEESGKAGTVNSNIGEPGVEQADHATTLVMGPPVNSGGNPED